MNWAVVVGFVHVCVIDVRKLLTAVLNGGTPEYHEERRRRKKIDIQRMRQDALKMQHETSLLQHRFKKQKRGEHNNGDASISQMSVKMKKGKRKKYVSAEGLKQFQAS